MAPTQSRIRPFSDSYQNIGNILVKNIHIPMGQRSYGWTKPNIDDFCNDLIKMFKDGEHIYTMGSMITYISGNIHHVYDGQHRLLTIAIVIIVLKRLLPEYGNSEPNIYTDGIMIEFTNKQREYNKTYKKIPKITCVCEKDMIALLDISNDNIDHWTQYIENIDEYIEDNDFNEYRCKKCNDDNSYSYKHFMKHIKKKHNYQVSIKSELYEAYHNIYNFIINFKNEPSFLKELYIFIVKYTEFQFFEYYSHTYVCQKFNWENNRGKIPEHIDIIKSQILVNIQSEQQNNVYEKIQEYRKISSDIYPKLGMNIIEISVQIYNKKITRKVDYNYEFKSIIESAVVYDEINNLFKIIDKISKIYDVITKNKYGRLLNNDKSVSLAWEGYKWCLLPILYTLSENKESKNKESHTYTLDSNEKEIIEIFAKWYFRHISFGRHLTFNSVKYSDQFIKISNKVLNGEQFDYKEDILKCLCGVTENNLKEEQYIAGLKEQSFKNNKQAKYLLMFLETKKINTSIEVTVPLNYTLEHIIPKKTGSDEIYFIGNLTLLEGQNSKNGHKGNSSIGANDYAFKKKESYSGSNSLITKELADKYGDFTTESIIERSDLIAKELEEFTNYFPKPQ
jgi:hypothetical protein